MQSAFLTKLDWRQIGPFKHKVFIAEAKGLQKHVGQRLGKTVRCMPRALGFYPATLTMGMLTNFDSLFSAAL
jgi:hypothetical protein